MNDGNSFNKTGPVVVAGVGGSGTRVLFQILSQLGFHMGSDLNRNGDNLWFTVLFKHSSLLKPPPNALPSNGGQHPIQHKLQLFHKLMTSNTPLTNDETYLFFKSANRYYRKLKPSLVKERVEARMKVLSNRREKLCSWDASHLSRWGWKEPNSFIYLDHLDRFYKNLKFIFIIRHGLDMAYSARSQYRYWSTFFGLDRDETWKDKPVAVKKLEYWLKANQFAIERGKQLPGNRFLNIRFDTLCQKPRETIDRLLGFLEIDTAGVNCSQLCKIPQTPSSSGRFRQQDLSLFSIRQLEGVSRFGFEF